MAEALELLPSASISASSFAGAGARARARRSSSATRAVRRPKPDRHNSFCAPPSMPGRRTAVCLRWLPATDRMGLGLWHARLRRGVPGCDVACQAATCRGRCTRYEQRLTESCIEVLTYPAGLSSPTLSTRTKRSTLRRTQCAYRLSQRTSDRSCRRHGMALGRHGMALGSHGMALGRHGMALGR